MTASVAVAVGVALEVALGLGVAVGSAVAVGLGGVTSVGRSVGAFRTSGEAAITGARAAARGAQPAQHSAAVTTANLVETRAIACDDNTRLRRGRLKYNRRVNASPPPLWLWRLARYGLGGLVLGVAALAAALALGLADPPRAGPLIWEDDFKHGLGRWDTIAPEGVRVAARDGALVIEFTAPGQTAFVLTDAPRGDFTFEVAAAQTAGESGAAYGLVFGWQGEARYAAALVNGNGYAEAWRQAGVARAVWFEWQQWPHILPGVEANRVRVDARAGQVSLRVNDERLIDAAAEAEGRLGLVARSLGSGRVVFSWARLWAGPDGAPK